MAAARFALVPPPLLAAVLIASLFQGCGPSAHESGLEWNGEPMRVLSRVEKPGDDALRTGGWETLTEYPPKRILGIAPGEWGDSQHLLEYEGNLEAYAAFQEMALQDEDVAAGLTVCGERVCFRRGRWIGVIDAGSWKGVTWFENALALPGAASAVGIPAVFGSLLQQGRLPGSERILTREFLGIKTEARIFTVRVECRGDTSLVYASPDLQFSFADALLQQPGWRQETTETGLYVSREISDLPPSQLQFSKRGMAGVEGCFDENLTKKWLKMQVRGLKGLK
jgi:hypothetical protein